MSVRKAKIHILLALLAGMALYAHGQDSALAWTKRLDAILLNMEYYKGFSGVVLVGQGDSVLFQEAYGYANEDEEEEMVPQDQFMIASLSKAFTAAAILKLVEDKKLSLDAPLRQFFPEFKRPGTDQITVLNLLNHTSGLPDYINDYPIIFRIRRWLGWTPKPGKLVKKISRERLEFKPGAEFNYSNSGYLLLAHIVEKISGQSFDQFLENQILTPLKLNRTSASDFAEASHPAVGYGGKFFRRKELKNLTPEVIFGMGGMYSTAGDLFQWVRGLNNGLILPDSLKTQMFDPGDFHYGLGWDVGFHFGELSWSHGGYLPGWNSQIFHLDESDLTCIVVSNYDDTDPTYITQMAASMWINHQPTEAVPGVFAEIPEEWKGRYAFAGDRQEMGSNFPDELLFLKSGERGVRIRWADGKEVEFIRGDDGKWVSEEENWELQVDTESQPSPELWLKHEGDSGKWRKLN